MRRIVLPGLLVVAAAAIVFECAAASAAVPAPIAEAPVKRLQTVVVSGQQAGPGLWKVSRDGHVLWILGIVSPVPRKMAWHSPQAEAELARAQEIIGPPGVSATMGWGGAFKMAFAMPTMLRARKNPDGKALRDVLPPDLYVRWSGLKALYLPRDDSVEAWRPEFAAMSLYEAATKSAGLEGSQHITERVYALADRYKLKRTSATIRFELKDPKGLAKSFTRSNVDGVACFRSVLDQLDSDVRDAADRANAWAVGDVAELARLTADDRRQSCLDAFMQVEAIREMGMADAIPRARQQWLAAVDAALVANAATFATLPMNELLGGSGLLAELRAKGYAVEAPE